MPHKSVFANQANNVFTDHRVKIYLHKIAGGIPANPQTLQSWITANIKDERRAKDTIIRSLIDLYPDAAQKLSNLEGAELNAAIKDMADELATTTHSNIFKRQSDTPIVEGRQVKACIKESASIVLNGIRLGGYKNTKGNTVSQKLARSIIPETVFIPEDAIPLQPDQDGDLHITHDQRPVHIKNPYTGETESSLKMTEVIHGCTAEFTLRVLNKVKDELAQYWPDIFIHAQENGLGADRSQGYGKFEVIKFDGGK